MAIEEYYRIQVMPSHVDWGEYRNPTNRTPIAGESYVKISADMARHYDIRRGNRYIAYFTNGLPSIPIKASGNGPYENGIQYAKQFEGIGRGACKAFTPWYVSCGIREGDWIGIKFLSENEVEFTKL